MGGFRSERDGRIDGIHERLQAVEKAVATQAQIDVQVRTAISNLAAALQELDQRAFIFGQQLAIIMKKAEDTHEMTSVLEREANDLRVDGNAYRNEIAGLAQRVDGLYTVLTTMGDRLEGAFNLASLLEGD